MSPNPHELKSDRLKDWNGTVLVVLIVAIAFTSKILEYYYKATFLLETFIYNVSWVFHFYKLYYFLTCSCFVFFLLNFWSWNTVRYHHILSEYMFIRYKCTWFIIFWISFFLFNLANMFENVVYLQLKSHNKRQYCVIYSLNIIIIMHTPIFTAMKLQFSLN